MRAHPTVVALTLLGSASAARGEPPTWAGVYVGPDEKSTAALVPVGDAIWWLDRGVQVVTVGAARAGAALAVAPIGGTLTPSRKGWTLRVHGEARSQVVDPFLVRLMAGLAGEHTFLHVGQDGRPDAGSLVVRDGLFAAVDLGKSDLGKKGCLPAILRPDPSGNHEKKVARVAPQPAPGAVAARTFLLLELDPEESPCGSPPSPSGPPRVHGGGAGAYVFARADGTAIGVELVGYMMVELFLARDATPTETREVFRAASEEAQRQAE